VVMFEGDLAADVRGHPLAGEAECDSGSGHRELAIGWG
jgi:hypothetical protein